MEIFFISYQYNVKDIKRAQFVKILHIFSFVCCKTGQKAVVVVTAVVIVSWLLAMRKISGTVHTSLRSLSVVLCFLNKLMIKLMMKFLQISGT